jgi:hypothetical protein
MALTKAHNRMISGAVVNVNDFGAVGDGVTDDTAAIQAAIDTGSDVVFPSAAYRITTPLLIGTQRLIGGVSDKPLNRSQTRINAGNHAVFRNKPNFPSFSIDGFYIYYGDTAPTVATGNDAKTAFLFEDNSGWPEYISISNCTVLGAWYGYFDDTGTYLSKLTQVACRHTRTGFYKSGGTTIHFDSCSSSDGIAGFYILNCISPVITNCSADGLTVPAGTAGNYFEQITSLVINGWDGESCVMSGNGAAYLWFKTTTATINGFSGVLNELTCSAGEEVYYVYSADNSYVTFNGFKINRDPTWLAFTGSAGTCFTLKAFNNGEVVLNGSDFSAPTGGTPTDRYSVGGFSGAWISLFGTFVDNLTNQVSVKSEAGNITIGNQLTHPNATSRFGTATSIGAGEANGGFGGERITVQGSGNDVLFSTTSSAGAGVPVTYARGNDGSLAYFFRNGTAVGRIDVSAGATAYVTTSDYRLKENVTDLQNATDRLKLFKPCRFNFIGSPEKTVDGFIAHEVQDIVPEAISGEKDAVDENGNIMPQGIDQSKLVPLLVAALQELEARIAALEP